MPCTERIRSIELTFSTPSFAKVDRWLWTDFSTLDSVPRTVRYRHHPRVGPSNPQIPRSRYNKAFRGHLFRVGRSKKSRVKGD